MHEVCLNIHITNQMEHENKMKGLFPHIQVSFNQSHFSFFFTKIVSQMIFISIFVSILEVTLEDAFMKCFKYSYNQMQQERITSVTFDKLYHSDCFCVLIL